MVKPATDLTIQISSITTGRVSMRIVGTSPLYYNSMNAKSQRGMLLPEVSGRRTKAERAVALKHEPIEEFRNSIYSSDEGPTRLVLPSNFFKGAMMNAALDLPGTRKTEIARLVWVENAHVPLYGIPLLKMDVVRMADPNRTPDVRTRAYLPTWATTITLQHIVPNLNAQSIYNLLHAAGILAGVGDFRQQKGKGSYGQFRLCDNKVDAEYDRIVSSGGRKMQDAALARAEPADDATAELLGWYQKEVLKLGDKSLGKLKEVA